MNKAGYTLKSMINVNMGLNATLVSQWVAHYR